MRLHFVSGLPRSGSTLLAAVLRQNPRFHAGMSSHLLPLYRANESAMSRANEGAVHITDARRRAVLGGVFRSYYEGEIAEVVFDTHRGWMTKLPALHQLLPDAKIICCVRDLAWIMDSFERLHCRNPLEPSGIYGFNNCGTVYDRAVTLANGNGPVGWSLNALREALAGEYSSRVLLVEYEDLCKRPGETLSRIYAFIGEPEFAHDFTRVEYSAGEFDNNIGARGLHEVSGAVRWKPRKTILPPDLFASYGKDQFWRAESMRPLGSSTIAVSGGGGGGFGGGNQDTALHG